MRTFIFAICMALGACGDFKRDNPYDPTGGSPVDLETLLVGTWSRDDAEKNEVYTFKEDSRVELRDYSSPSGGAIDRNASYPQTLVISFSGTYQIVGNLLRISFSRSQTNNPAGTPPALPRTDKVVEVDMPDRSTLHMTERDGVRIYTRI